jgi:hypothetical protein
VEAVQSADGVELILDTETQWHQPGRPESFEDLRGWWQAASQSLGFTKSYTRIGDPFWRVYVTRGDDRFPGSTWTNDWSHIERNLARWLQTIPRMTADEVQREAARLAMTSR